MTITHSLRNALKAKQKKKLIRNLQIEDQVKDILASTPVSLTLDSKSGLFACPATVDDLTTKSIPIFGIYEDENAAVKSKLPIQKLTVVLSARELRDRFLSYWSSISIVCALLSSISVSVSNLPCYFTLISLVILIR